MVWALNRAFRREMDWGDGLTIKKNLNYYYFIIIWFFFHLIIKLGTETLLCFEFSTEMKQRIQI